MRTAVPRKAVSLVSATALAGSVLVGTLLGAPTNAVAAPAPDSSGIQYKEVIRKPPS